MKTNREAVILSTVSVILFAILVLGGFLPRVFQEQEASPNDKYGSMIARVMDFIQNSYVEEVDTQTLVDGAMRGLFESVGDPYSTYLSASDLEALRDTTDGDFGGVGLYINKIPPNLLGPEDDLKSFYVEVVSPIEGTPAFKAGILAGDYISHIEGESVNNLTIDDILDRLRGTPGTDVTVTILRGGKVSIDVDLTRALIEIPTVRSALIDGSIGYLRIIQFTPYTAESVQETLEEFKTAGATSLIVDLRSNPGGLLDSVAKIGDYFFDDGVIVSTKSRVVNESVVFEATPQQIVPDQWPIIALIDNGSASASEILAGALKDRGRALLMGQTSYGKGSVQRIYPVDYFSGQPFQFANQDAITRDSRFKLTIARYFTPADINIDKIGIEPNIPVEVPEYTEEELESFRDLFEARKISSFAENNPDASKADIDRFIQSLRNEGYAIPERLLRRQINNEIFKVNGQAPPEVDLEWDIVLKAAVERLRSGEPLL
jgi:carboxyl-terminal processing protease